MMESLGQLIFFLLTPLSHIGASLFFAKPRFGKWATAAIWLLYVALMMLLPPDTPTVNFFLTLAAHFILFFVTTAGSVQEKGFLFFSRQIKCQGNLLPKIAAHNNAFHLGNEGGNSAVLVVIAGKGPHSIGLHIKKGSVGKGGVACGTVRPHQPPCAKERAPEIAGNNDNTIGHVFSL